MNSVVMYVNCNVIKIKNLQPIPKEREKEIENASYNNWNTN